ncbi:MAG: thioredoxin, partial [Gammaproteobacteria bacterium]
MANGLVLHASEVDFEQRVLEASAERAVLVDFWAGWCAPCRALAPVLEDLALRHPEGLAVVKVDTDAEQALAARYGIRSLPTLLVFRHGEVVGQSMGAQPLAALERLIEPHLPRATDALLAAAHAAEALGDAATAIAELERAHGLDASDYRVHPRLAALYVDAGRATEARALLAALPANLQVDAAVEAVEAR